ncbi:hypothetical protein U1Q18_001028 [Sarracenia purpurea var. burkii]
MVFRTPDEKQVGLIQVAEFQTSGQPLFNVESKMSSSRELGCSGLAAQEGVAYQSIRLFHLFLQEGGVQKEEIKLDLFAHAQ